jgi:hypothetical protein
LANKSVSTFLRTPGMMLVISFFTLFGVNAVLLYLANMFFPQYIVLGTQSMNTWWAILHSMGTLALFLVLLLPFATILERKLGRELKPQEWIVGYFIAIGSIWYGPERLVCCRWFSGGTRFGTRHGHDAV